MITSHPPPENHPVYETTCTTRQATDDNMAHGHYSLHTQGYRHTLTISNACCFTNATMVARMCLNVTSYVCMLPVLFCFLSSLPSSPHPLSPPPSVSCCMLSRHVTLCDLRYNTVQLFNTLSIKNLFHFQETAMKQSV